MALVVLAAAAFVLSRGGEPGVGTAKELRRTVEVRSGTGAFESVRTHPKVIAGDLVRTGRRGRGQIDYGDGSITRLDSNTRFEVKELTTSTKRVMRSELTRGRIWNNVRKLASVEDRFEVRTPNAVATVRGTIFMVEVVPDGRGGTQTTVAQVTGRTDVQFDERLRQLAAGGCTTNGGACKYTPEELAAMPFMQRYSGQDGVPLPWASKPATEAAEATGTEPQGLNASGDPSTQESGSSDRSGRVDPDIGDDTAEESDQDDDKSEGRGSSKTSVSDGPSTSDGDNGSSDSSDDSAGSGGSSDSGSSDSGSSDSGSSDSGSSDSGGGDEGGESNSSRNRNDCRGDTCGDGDAGKGNDDK